MYLFARILFLVRILTILDHIEGVRAQKPPKNGSFVDAKSVRKILEINNRNLIASLVKLLHKLANIWGVFHEKPPKLGLK